MLMPSRSFALGILLAASGASPALAGRPQTRLVSCEAGSCLLVTGRRADAAASVAINGHTVTARGARSWRVSLPVETVRTWSAPHARAITVSVIDGEAHEVASTKVDLPIGLLDHGQTLAMLVVSAK